MRAPRFAAFGAVGVTMAVLSLLNAYLAIVGRDFTRESTYLILGMYACTLAMPGLARWAMIPVHEAAALALKAAQQAAERAAAESRLMKRRLQTRRARYRRAARIRKAGGFSDDLARAHRRALYGDRCWVCAAPAQQMDHVIAVARGGTNWPANLRPICPRCNQSKGAKDWRPVAARAVGIPRPARLP